MVRQFRRRLGLVGGTAAALGLGALFVIPSMGPQHTLISACTGPTGYGGTGYNCDQGHQREVEQEYQDDLGRNADSAGKTYWVGQLDSGTVSHTQFAVALLSSDEYRARVVNFEFQHYLNRSPDSAGQTYWMNQLLHGARDETVATNITASNEYFSKAGGNNKSYVDKLYTDILGRTADSSGETYWVTKLNGGTARSVVSGNFLGSDEYINHLVAGPSVGPTGTYAQGLYGLYLDRAADSGGQTYWTGLLRQGKTDEQVAAGLAGSDEYYNLAQCTSCAT